MRSRSYVFTWNNYPDDYTNRLDTVECQYIVAGRETGESGTPHLQGYVYFKTVKSPTQVHRLLPGCHVEIARGNPQQADEYCRKDDQEPYVRGTRPYTQKEKGEAERARWESAWNLAKQGKVEEIDPKIRLRYYGAIRRIERDFMPPVGRLVGPCGVWIFGLAGAGKTRAVLDAFPEAYPKPRTQWWDGYQGERIVYVDDVDIFDVKLGGSLKLWSDAYPFIGEIKGGSQKIRPDKLIVTSQYRIEDIWSDAETRQALLRRFIVLEKKIGEEINLL